MGCSLFGGNFPNFKVMKETLKKLLGLLLGGFIKDLGEAADKVFTSKEEKLEKLAELERLYIEQINAIANLVDTDPDSWLSKNVRPLVFLLGFLSVTAMLFFDFGSDPGLQKMYTGWVGGMITFYFVRREYLKYVKRKNESS